MKRIDKVLRILVLLNHVCAMCKKQGSEFQETKFAFVQYMYDQIRVT